VGVKLTLVMIGTYFPGSCKSNYHMTITAPRSLQYQISDFHDFYIALNYLSTKVLLSYDALDEINYVL